VNHLAETDQVSRREFVKMAGAAIGGLAIGAVGGYSLMPEKTTEVEVPVEVEVPAEMPARPWEYKTLDVEAVKARAYEAYFQKGCAYGAYEGVIGVVSHIPQFHQTCLYGEKQELWDGVSHAES